MLGEFPTLFVTTVKLGTTKIPHCATTVMLHWRKLTVMSFSSNFYLVRNFDMVDHLQKSTRYAHAHT